MSHTKSERRNRTAKEMYPLVEAYRSGEMSRKDFCDAHGVPVSALNYWQSKYLRDQRLEQAEKRNGFVQLKPVSKASATAVMELKLSGGTLLRFFEYPQADYLLSLLKSDRC